MPPTKYAHGDPDPLAALAHDDNMKNKIIAHALMYVSNHFNAFLADIAQEGKLDELKQLVTKQLFDIWVFPLISHAAANLFRDRVIAGAFTLSDSETEAALRRFMEAHDDDNS